MSTLQERLDRINARFTEAAPAPALEIMHRATDDVRASGILDLIPSVGDALPAFEMLDTEGTPMRSQDLLADGPLIMSFYRGVW
jgi:hypothetical protein